MRSSSSLWISSRWRGASVRSGSRERCKRDIDFWPDCAKRTGPDHAAMIALLSGAALQPDRQCPALHQRPCMPGFRHCRGRSPQPTLSVQDDGPREYPKTSESKSSNGSTGCEGSSGFDGCGLGPGHCPRQIARLHSSTVEVSLREVTAVAAAFQVAFGCAAPPQRPLYPTLQTNGLRYSGCDGYCYP